MFAITKDEANVGPSRVVSSQIFITNLQVYSFLDSGATHSFVSDIFADKIGRSERINEIFRTTLP